MSDHDKHIFRKPDAALRLPPICTFVNSAQQVCGRGENDAIHDHRSLESVASIAERTGIREEIDGADQRILKKAWRIAVEVHGLQVDKAGAPYLFHVARVAMAMDTPLLQVCALLHDVLEDTADSGAYYSIIRHEFPYEVLDCCEALCRRDVESYKSYIERVALNPLAVKVKLADLADNLNPERLSKLPKEQYLRLLKRYADATTYLKRFAR